MADRLSYYPDIAISDLDAMTWIDSRVFSSLKAGLDSIASQSAPDNRKEVWLTETTSLSSDFNDGSYVGIDLVVKKGVTLQIIASITLEFNIIVEDGGQVKIDENLTVNGNLESKGSTSGVIPFLGVDGDETFTINGSIQAGPWQVFGTNLINNVILNGHGWIEIEWFGAKRGSANATQTANAINAAVASLHTNVARNTPSGGIIHIPSTAGTSNWFVDSPIDLLNNGRGITLKGDGATSSVIQPTAGSAIDVIKLDNVESDPHSYTLLLEKFMILGDGTTNQRGIYLHTTPRTWLKQIIVDGCDNNIVIEYSWVCDFHNVFSFNANNISILLNGTNNAYNLFDVKGGRSKIGLYIGVSSNQVNVIGGSYEGNSEYGIYCGPCNAINIQTYFEANDIANIGLASSTTYANGRIESGNIQNCNQSVENIGIEIGSVSNLTIDNNWFKGAGSSPSAIKYIRDSANGMVPINVDINPHSNFWDRSEFAFIVECVGPDNFGVLSRFNNGQISTKLFGGNASSNPLENLLSQISAFVPDGSSDRDHSFTILLEDDIQKNGQINTGSLPQRLKIKGINSPKIYGDLSGASNYNWLLKLSQPKQSVEDVEFELTGGTDVRQGCLNASAADCEVINCRIQSSTALGFQADGDRCLFFNCKTSSVADSGFLPNGTGDKVIACHGSVEDSGTNTQLIGNTS